jgi:tRNA pseudouridine55 synthase
MDGVLIIDKPAGITSHDVVNRVRRILKTRRVGHAGTLDPFATGVLVLLIGKATRLARFVDKAVKEYVAEIRFGFATDTGDLTGTSLGEEEGTEISTEDIQHAVARFRGEIEQTPPMYSAKKVAGKKLYELARKGETVERKSFVANVYDLDILNTDLESGEKKLTIRVVCSAGTYVRTLGEDIGKALNAPAHLTALRRTAAGPFVIENAISLAELEKTADPVVHLRRIETVIADLPKIELTSERASATMNGMSTRVNRSELGNDAVISMYSPDGDLIAIGVYDSGEECIKPTIVLR